MIISAVLALSAEVINQINHAKTENELIYQIKYIKDRLFKVADSIVMATPKQPEQPPAPVPQSVGAIGIVSPEDGAAVPDQAIVKGFASDTKSKVWVIVHPTETGAYWVQPAVELRKDGNWMTLVYIGDAGSSGMHFEILALANPKSVLHEAEVLGTWPDAQSYSQIIEVTRK